MFRLIVCATLLLLCLASVHGDTGPESLKKALDSLDGVVTTNPAQAIKLARKHDKPILFYLYDRDAEEYGRLGYRVHHFISRDPTKKIIFPNYVQCVTARQHKDVRDLIPNEENKDLPHLMVTTPQGNVLFYERLRPNPVDALKQVQRMREAVDKHLKEHKPN